MPRAVIWDVDGTLIDSSVLHFEAWLATLEREGVQVTQERFQATFGQRNDAVLRAFIHPDLTDDEIDRIAAAKEVRYRELVRTRGMEPLPGVRHWLAELGRTGWRQGIASSAPHANLGAILESIGLASYFDVVVSGDDVQYGKPDPQVFLLAARRLDVSPHRSVVVEDALAGVEGARRAGMRCVGVLGGHTTLDADIVTPSLDRLPPDAFERLVPALP